MARAAHGLDAAVIGGGFFGCSLALDLKRQGMARVALYEREPALMRRASYANQARIHNGYHYPRALRTAQRSRANFARFVEDYRFAAKLDMIKLYAIGSTSRVNAVQFESFCAKIGAPCRVADGKQQALFNDDLIDEVFAVSEIAFDADRLARTMANRLDQAGVDVRLGCDARVASADDLHVDLDTSEGARCTARVINCTYAALDLAGVHIRSRLKRELAELVLIRPPPAIASIGVTVMDGPFFSTMPFPAANLHSLSHVVHTPHAEWTRADVHAGRPKRSNRLAMLRDASRFMPCLVSAEPVRSIFEIKTVLADNEGDDGRPILFEVSAQSPRIVTVMGSKIDNVYDALDALRAHDWEQ